MTVWKRMIAHVDMDAFYAALEVRDNPSLRGLPVVVGGDPRRRGVVSAASYPARKYGIRSAMPMATAVRLCPDLVILPGSMAKYRSASDILRQVLHEFSPLVEPLSLDEAFLDLTGSQRRGSPRQIGEEIRRRIVEELAITGSVGIAGSKFVAKLASDHRKPDGLTVVDPAAAAAFVQSRPLERLWGVGPSTLAALRRAGIASIAALARASESRLRRDLGKAAEQLIRLAQGIDERPVVPAAPPKSISHEITFAQDVADDGVLAGVLLALAEKVARRARRCSVAGRTVVLKTRTADFRTTTRNRTLRAPTQDATVLYDVVRELFSHLDRGGKAVRLLGVGIGGLVEAAQLELGLFADADQARGRSAEKLLSLQEAEDAIVRKFGKSALARARTLLAGETPDTGTFGEGTRRS